MLDRHVVLELYQQALPANPGMQRVKRLHLVERVRREDALAQRGHAEVAEGVLEGRAAEAARRRRHLPRLSDRVVGDKA
jgi:hypothetical protein